MTKNPIDWILLIPICFMVAAMVLIFLIGWVKNLIWVFSIMKFQIKVLGFQAFLNSMFNLHKGFRVAKSGLKSIFLAPEISEEFGFSEIRKSKPELSKDIDRLESLFFSTAKFTRFVFIWFAVTMPIVLILGILGAYLQEKGITGKDAKYFQNQTDEQRSSTKQ